ncbi:MAG: flagellin [Lachnospiraceae bacterium]|nr:flagellin [Lachnospiraceae bacterium]
MVVQHNITAMNSNRMLGITTSAQAKSTEKLSSGYKINRAADDAAGLSISEKMRRQVRGLTQASANAQDGISCVQTAEGALNEVQDMLQRMNELAVKGENGTLTTTDRAYIQSEVKQLMEEVDRVQSTTTFNEKSLLDGTFTGVGLQVGAEPGQHIDIDIKDMSMDGLAAGIDDDLYTDIKYYALNDKGVPATTESTMETATAEEVIEKMTGLESGEDSTVATAKDFNALNAFVKGAISLVSQQRSDLGAVQNRLEHTINNLDNVVENTTAAESAIRDTDIATEMVKYSNNNILQQAGTSMLSQANQSNQLALSLLG